MDTIGNSPHARIACSGAPVATKTPDSRQSSLRKIVHNTRWSAPEVLRGENPSKESDVHAFAMIMVEVRYESHTMHVISIYQRCGRMQIFTNQAPFSNMTDSLAISTIIAGERPPRPTHPSCTDNLWSLMQRCWDQNSHSRPDAPETLQIILDPLVPCSFWGHIVYNSHYLLPSDTPTNEQAIGHAPPESPRQSTTFSSSTSGLTQSVTTLPSSTTLSAMPCETPPSHPALQKLVALDKSIFKFHGQLSDVLYGEEYARCVTELEDDDLLWLVDYLNEVCCRVFPLPSPLNLA